MTGDNMKSGVVESDRVKIEGRQSLHRRKMSKNAPLVNGAAGDSVGYENDGMVIRQVNLAAAYHDHISCTKSADICKVADAKENRLNMPCETDHIYANCSDKTSKSHGVVVSSPSKDKIDEKKQLHEMCLLQLQLIKHLEEENDAKDKQIKALKQENELLKVRQERMERRVCMMKKSAKLEESDGVSEAGSILSNSQASPGLTQATSESANPTAHSAVHLVTRYFGRKSKTIPSRALKRRYFPPPKSLPCKKADLKHSLTTASLSSTAESQEKGSTAPCERAILSAPAAVALPPPAIAPSSVPNNEQKKVRKKRGRRPKVIPKTEDFLTTDKEYYLPDYYNSQNFLDSTKTIHVPSWRFRPIPSFYQMEGTENIDDRVFQRRHLKCEQDEKRRKRWDIQRLREQKASEKLKQYKQGNSGDGLLQKKPESLFPNPNKFEYIEVTEKLPVLAFGRPIPLFQPSEFSLPWKVSEFRDVEKTRKSATTGSKVT